MGSSDGSCYTTVCGHFSLEFPDDVVCEVGSGSSGSGGGVVAMVHPIQAAMTRTAATATKAVICRTTIA
jgi:hypothetical protein